jgi:phenylpropionate dioxygenase-like ring-hydroxylating dioxygenase large terminal subunit
MTRPEDRFAHPLVDATALTDAPLAVRALGDDWVLWRDADGTPRAAPDRCPHRGAALSRGRVCAGELQCPYHGWRFAGDGRCTAVPAVPGFVPPATHGLASRALTEAAGLLWLQPDGAAARLPHVPPAHGLRTVRVGPYAVATSAPRVIENFLDIAHFATVHEGWLGDADHPVVPDHRVDEDALGFVAEDVMAWQPQSNRLAREGSWVRYRYEVRAPYAARLVKWPQAQPGYRDEIEVWACPVDDESSRVWFHLALTDNASTDAQIAAFQHTIFQQDQPVLESQRPKRLPLSGEVHSAADRSSAAYRRLLRRWGITLGVLP